MQPVTMPSLPVLTYARTVLELGRRPPLRIDLRAPVGPAAAARLRALGLRGTFAVVTPCNPFGRPAGPAANADRLAALRDELAAGGVHPVPADGVSPDGEHREPGFALDLPAGESTALARRWDQLALYWFDGEAFWILPALAEHPPVRLPIDGVEPPSVRSTEG